MIWTGKIRVQAPIQRVWDMLLQPAILQACLPGIEKIERLDERNYTIVIAQKVGFLTKRFNMKATLTKVEPPLHLEIEGHRLETRKTGGAIARIDLQETAGNAVEISYTVDANIAGTLVLLGDKLIQNKVKKIETEFATALQERIDKKP